MFKKILLSLVLVFAVIGGFFVVNSPNQAQAISGNWVCVWEKSHSIQCRKPSGWEQRMSGVKQFLADFVTLGLLGDLPSEYIAEMDRQYTELDCSNDGDCGYYTYRPGLSEERGWPIYCTTSAQNSAGPRAAGCLHFNNLVSTLPVQPKNDGGDNMHIEDCAKKGLASCLDDYGENLKLTDAAANDKFLPKLNWNDEDDSPNYWVVGRNSNATLEPGRYCSWTKSKDCIIKMPRNSLPPPPEGETRYTGVGLSPATVDKFRASVLVAQSQEYCESSAPLGFITCPIYKYVTEGISKLIGGQGTSGARQGLLIDFLTFKAPDGPGLANTVGGIVVVANLFYVVIFLILIFSSSIPAIGMDNYTIKKTLPKFIAAVIMTQFSYVICFAIVDFFNILGNAMPNLIFALPIGVGSPPDSIGGGLGGALVVGGAVLIGTVGWILVFIIAIIALIACLVAFVYIILRYLVLFILVLLSPIAFASWVLPGTKKFFDQWWTNFIRLNAMFVMITGMLALSIMLSRALIASPGGGGGALSSSLQLVGMILPIIALLLIPKTLKWTTKGMNALAAGAMGAVSGKMGAAGRGMGSMGKKGYGMGKDMAKKSANELRASKSAELFGRGNQRAAAILGGRLPTKKGILKTGQQSEAYNTEANKQNSSALKSQGDRLNGLTQGKVKQQLADDRGMKGRALERESARIEQVFTDSNAAIIARGNGDPAITSGFDLYNHQLEQVAQGSGSDLLGVKSGDDKAMQTAAIGAMGARGHWDGLRRAKESKRADGSAKVDATTMSAGLEPHMADVMAKAPDIIKGSAAAFDGISASKAVALDATTMKVLVAHATGPNGSIPGPISGITAKDNLTAIGNEIHGDKNLRNALDSASKTHLNGASIVDTTPGATGPLNF